MAKASDSRRAVEQMLVEARSLLPDQPLRRPREEEKFLGRSVPKWEPWERRLWEIGEEIRQILIAAPTLRRDESLAREILAMSLDRRGGFGRQSFMMLLGRRSFASFAKELASQLSDEEVCGHAVWALYRAKVHGVSAAVRPLCDHGETWIRNEARRYITWDGV